MGETHSLGQRRIDVIRGRRVEEASRTKMATISLEKGPQRLALHVRPGYVTSCQADEAQHLLHKLNGLLALPTLISGAVGNERGCNRNKVTTKTAPPDHPVPYEEDQGSRLS